MNIQDSIRLIEVSHKTGADNIHDFGIGIIVLAAIVLIGFGFGWLLKFTEGYYD